MYWYISFVICTTMTVLESSLSTRIPDEDLVKLVNVLKSLDLHQGIRVSGSNQGTLTRIAKFASQEDILSTSIESLERGQVWPIVHVSDNPTDLNNFIDILKNQEYRSDELILVTNYSFAPLRDIFKSTNLSRAFLSYQLGQDARTIHRIQTFRDRPLLVEMSWHVSTGNNKFDKAYDFQGAPMTLLGTVYDFPYLVAVPCEDKSHLACQAFGPDVETLSYIMAKYNFTLEIHLEPNNDHGVIPIEGTIGDLNATYGGILGQLLDDDYDRGSTAWQHTWERSFRAEFSINCIFIKAHFVMDVGKAVKNDWTLYFRPFTQSLWNACVIILSITICLYHLIKSVSSRKRILNKADQSLKMVAFFGWFCYVLVKCYYEGALTMFFTTTTGLPFNSFTEALSRYPEFELHVRQGQESFVHFAARQGHPAVLAQVERINDNPDIQHESTLSLVQALTKPGAFALVVTGEVRAVLDAYPIPGLNLKKLFISRPDSGYYSILYPKRSPWRSALDNGYRDLLSSGQFQKILNRWLPADLKSEEIDPKDQLGFRQVWLCFIVLYIFQGLAILVLAFELLIRPTCLGNKYLSR